MSPDESVTHWIDELKSGSSTAAAELWRHFHGRLIGLARQRLRAAPKRVADEEDVVVSAFETFFRRAEQGQFPRLDDRHNLWQVLVAITERKALNQLRNQARLKRGGGQVRGESVFQAPDGSSGGRAFGQVAGREPTPEFAAIIAEDLQRLLDALDDDELSQIALAKLEGCTNEEIAARIGRSAPTVERRLKLIRRKWETQ